MCSPLQSRRSKLANGHLIALAMFVLLANHHALKAQNAWEEPVAVSKEGNDVGSGGGRPRASTSQDGKWVAVWQRNASGPSLYSRSTDFAVKWTKSANLPTADQTQSNGNPSVATDLTSGTSIVVWEASKGAGNFFALGRRTATQTTVTGLSNLQLPNSSTHDKLSLPAIDSAGNLVWIAGGTAAPKSGADQIIALFRSTNDGTNWGNPLLLGQNSGAQDFEQGLDLATDRSSAWVAVWERRTGSFSSPSSISAMFSRSSDNGSTWTVAAPLNSTAPDGRTPAVAADAADVFLAITVVGSGSAAQLTAYRSTNGGSTWSAPIPVDAVDLAGTNAPANPDIACDGVGNCVAVWEQAISGKKKIFFATSTDSGNTWSAADAITSSPTSAADQLPHVKYDGQGRWVAFWQRTSDNGSRKIHVSRLAFPERADLSVTQTVEPDPILKDQVLTYTITLKNSGPLPATNVVMTDALPTSNTFVEATASKAGTTITMATSSSIVFNVGDMAVDETITAEVVLIPLRTGVQSNGVSVTSTEPDTDYNDRVSTLTSTVLVDGVDLVCEYSAFLFELPRRPIEDPETSNSVKRQRIGKLDIDTTLTVKNLGTRRAIASTILFVFSDDEFLSDDDDYFHAERIDYIPKGESKAVHILKDVHRYTPWYGKRLLAIVDSEHRVDEAEETNNFAQSEQLPIPDFVP